MHCKRLLVNLIIFSIFSCQQKPKALVQIDMATHDSLDRKVADPKVFDTVDSNGRTDDPLPKISPPIATISTLTGWTKNDIGKWISGQNALPSFNHEVYGYRPYCETLLRIERCSVEYDGHKYQCLAKFEKHIYGDRNEKIEYPVQYWLYDPARSFPITGKDKSVKGKRFKTYFRGDISRVRPTTWTDISMDIKVNFRKTYRELVVQWRNNTANSTVQFMIADYDRSSTMLFNFGICDIYNLGKNTELAREYYEVPKEAFVSLVNIDKM